MIEPVSQDRVPLDVEPGDIVVSRHGTRRALIIKKEFSTGAGNQGQIIKMPYYSIYTLYFAHCPDLVGQTDHFIPLWREHWSLAEKLGEN
jgi:hypothetical protein